MPSPSIATIDVKPGETLWSIAEREYGDGNRYRDVYLLNVADFIGRNASSKIGPDFIYPGDKLKVLRYVDFEPSGH